MKKKFVKLLFWGLMCSCFSCRKTDIGNTNTIPLIIRDSADIVIYGGTSAGVAAAVQVARLGKTAILVCNASNLGGMTTGGLSATDRGNASIIGGFPQEFYRKVGNAYNQSVAEYNFEPHIAQKVFDDYIRQYQNLIYVIYNQRINLNNGVERNGTIIKSLILESGKKVIGKQFIDASYEGDLLKCAKISYTYGRESNATYGETLNGMKLGTKIPGNISPYIIPNDEASGLLSDRINKTIPVVGQADNKIQAYNFRLTMTNNTANMKQIEEPENYNPNDYILLYRLIRSGVIKEPSNILSFSPIRNGKFDVNNGGATAYISSDFVGGNVDYLEGSYTKRDAIVKKHKDYLEGLLWTLQHSDSIPENIKSYYQKMGLAKDEFVNNENWPGQLYVREGRRMISDYVITEKTVLGNEIVNDPVALGSYTIDAHYAEYYVGANKLLHIEGIIGKNISKPYPISFRAIVPKEKECSNLSVPVCLSASHVAFSSIRMEPQYMLLGQSCGVIASLAIDEGVAVQSVNIAKMRLQLEKEKMILEIN